MEDIHWKTTVLILLTTILASIFLPSSTGIGISYGTNGNNLPTAQDAINLYKRCNVHQTRLFEPNHDILDALRNAGLLVTVGVRNEEIPDIANDPSRATQWVEDHIMPYKGDVSFQYIALGNELVPGPFATHVALAMSNMQNALESLGLLGDDVKVTTIVPTSVLEASYPPSEGRFSSEVVGEMEQIIKYLSTTYSPLMINVYPYFSYVAEPNHISLEYATFRAKEPIEDGDYKYYNLFDATVDAFHAAIEKINVGLIGVAISETGWPTLGNEPYSSKDNAEAYNANLLNHVLNFGTPRRPNQLMDVFIFALFNENEKAGGVEQNFGVFYPNMGPVYPLFSC